MIPLFKVAMSDEAAARVAEVLASGYIGQGPQVEAFEAALQDVLNTPEPPLTTNSCTSALDLALHLIGVGPGDAVITTPVTCTATNSVIVRRGARPVWADVDPLTGLIDPASVAERLAVTPGVKAIMAVDWGGALCDYGSLKAFGLPVIQDAAHHLSSPQGDYACYSFQAIKFLTTGDGGALWCPLDELERARLLRWYGLDRRSKADFRCEQNIQEVGYKYHMNDIAAAIGLANIPELPWILGKHWGNALYYHHALAGLPGITRPVWNDGSAWWLYTLLVDDRQSFISWLADHGIAASPVHTRNDTHAAFDFPSGPLPGVDRFASRNVAIPVGWWVSDVDREQIERVIQGWAHAHG
jgi:dTDP-4-amino-4,6-dideoxy-D-glucose/dTDP-4-amino-2,4-dideoxy-beta-L-xylose transaminase